MAVPLLPAAFAVLMPWAIYRRVRMNIGRQALSPRRLKLRSTVMVILFVLFGVPGLLAGRLDVALALAAGVTLGLLVALLALRHTTFLQENGQEYYVPHPWLGLALVTLLLGRMGYRFWQMYPVMMQGGAMPATPLSTLSPLTLGLLSLILAYNMVFSIGLLRHIAKRPR